jgi:hypothetical protein
VEQAHEQCEHLVARAAEREHLAAVINPYG